MKKSIKTSDLTPEVIEYLKSQGVNMEGKGGRYLKWEPVNIESLSTEAGIYKVNNGNLYKAGLTKDGIAKNAVITVFAKASKAK